MVFLKLDFAALDLSICYNKKCNYSALKGRFIKAQGSALGAKNIAQAHYNPFLKLDFAALDLSICYNNKKCNYSALKGRFIKAQGSALGAKNISSTLQPINIKGIIDFYDNNTFQNPS
ncbi:MAG: hypothetical protein DRR19_15080 [Candidatus Parabeggiatoa sp. nov. 1]|nr:MAG: hypothetical protein DRR19_15080 [Gammaproteobacteria bacterium]HEC85719.1 hypothetical protein [Thioploca sp.]